MNKQLIKKWRQDLHYKCRKSDLMNIHRFTPANDLLKQFSHGKQCADILHNLFKKHITGSFRSSIDESIVPAEQLMQTKKELHVEETASRLNLPTELSIFTKDATITSDRSLGSIANIIPTMDYPNALDTREALVMPPSEISLHRSSEISASLVSHDIFAQLEVLWCDQEYVEFNKLISDLRRPKDITTIFHILLELYAEQKIVLVQKDCHDTLWIKKYNEND